MHTQLGQVPFQVLGIASLKAKNVPVPLGSLIHARDARVFGGYDQVSK